MHAFNGISKTEKTKSNHYHIITITISTHSHMHCDSNPIYFAFSWFASFGFLCLWTNNAFYFNFQFFCVVFERKKNLLCLSVKSEIFILSSFKNFRFLKFNNACFQSKNEKKSFKNQKKMNNDNWERDRERMFRMKKRIKVKKIYIFTIRDDVNVLTLDRNAKWQSYR